MKLGQITLIIGHQQKHLMHNTHNNTSGFSF